MQLLHKKVNTINLHIHYLKKNNLFIYDEVSYVDFKWTSRSDEEWMEIKAAIESLYCILEIRTNPNDQNLKEMVEQLQLLLNCEKENYVSSTNDKDRICFLCERKWKNRKGLWRKPNPEFIPFGWPADNSAWLDHACWAYCRRHPGATREDRMMNLQK